MSCSPNCSACADLKASRARMRALVFFRLFLSAKQIVDKNPGRFPYLEYDVNQLETHKLVTPPEVLK
jgi:hypothetical protein